MRFILAFLSFILLANCNVLAQAEIAQQQFERGLINASGGPLRTSVERFPKRARKIQIRAGLVLGEFAAKINHNVGVCLYRLGRVRDAAAVYLETALELSKNRYRQAFHAPGIVEGRTRKPGGRSNLLSLPFDIDKRDGES